MYKIATGFSTGSVATPELASAAVSQAMDKAGLSHANSVLLFLTSDFALEPELAIRLTSKITNCTQIIGCAALGILTEEKTIVESVGAAAMVFGGDINLASITKAETKDLVLTLASPNALSSDKMDLPGIRIGGFAFTVWGSGKVFLDGVQQCLITATHSTVAVSQGVEALSPIMELTEIKGLDLVKIDHKPALETLIQCLPGDERALQKIPLDVLLAAVIFGPVENALSEGRYKLHTIRSFNLEQHTVRVSSFLEADARMAWVVRRPDASQRDMELTLDRAQAQLRGNPDFGLLFPCVGRGPYFYGGVDLDVELVKNRFPGMPILGCYCNGQIGPLGETSHLFQRTTVLGLFESSEKT